MESKKYIAAIDLGSSNVVVAVGSKAAGGKINIEEVVVMESAGVSAGEVKNVESAAASIKKAVVEIEDRLDIKISEVYAGISGSHIRCAKHPYYVYVADKDGEISAEDVRKLNESMHNMQAPDGYRLMHIIPQHYMVNDDEEVLDPVGRFGKTLGSTFNLIIGENNIIARLDKAFQKVGVKQIKLFINPLAMAEAVTFPDEKELGVAVVDIGAGITDICIYQDGIVRNVSVIPLGADSINKDIRSYGIMERYVEDLKVLYGCAMPDMVEGEKLVKIPGRTPNDYKDISFRNLASIIEARMLDIIDYVVEEIKDAGYEGKLGAGIVLTGGSALLKEVKTLFEKRTGLDVRIANPDILVAAESKEKAADPRLSAAIGTLWQGIGSGLETKVEQRMADNDNAPVSQRTMYDRIIEQQNSRLGTEEDDLDDAEQERGREREREREREQRPVKAKQKKVKKTKRRDYDDPDDDVDGGDMPEKEVKEKGKGLFGKLRDAWGKVVDLDVLDDDTTI